MDEAAALITLMRNGGLRCRTGILRLGIKRLGTEKTIAASLGVELVNFVDLVLPTVPPKANFLALTLDKIVQCLNEVSDRLTGLDCAIISNFDLGLAKLTLSDRAAFWRWFFQDLPHKQKAIIVCLPDTDAPHSFLPEDEIRREWQGSGRIAHIV